MHPPKAIDLLAWYDRHRRELPWRVTPDMRAAGAWVFSNGLLPPSSATVLRPQGGEVLVTDGPFAEGKEHLGGFTIVDVPDLDAALEGGRRVALATTLPIEVRPFAG